MDARFENLANRLTGLDSFAVAQHLNRPQGDTLHRQLQ
jgi:hypothetical protein